jgi:hypothetical protein
MITIPSWLEILRFRFKLKTKPYNILSNTKKLLFIAYLYDEINARCNVTKDELCF